MDLRFLYHSRRFHCSKHSYAVPLFLFVAIAILAFSLPRAYAQGGFDDDRVMLQGFYWESYRHGDPAHPEFGDKRWYQIVAEQAPELRDARFDLIWLPPPSYAGSHSAGY